MTGTIDRLMKNFGFIRSGGRSYFFHASSLKNIAFAQLEIGREVTFEDVEDSKGWSAVDIFI